MDHSCLTASGQEVSQQTSDGVCETKKLITSSSNPTKHLTVALPNYTLSEKGVLGDILQPKYNRTYKASTSLTEVHSSALKSPPRGQLALLQDPCPSRNSSVFPS